MLSDPGVAKVTSLNLSTAIAVVNEVMALRSWVSHTSPTHKSCAPQSSS
jgi:hypothetical protein